MPERARFPHHDPDDFQTYGPGRTFRKIKHALSAFATMSFPLERQQGMLFINNAGERLFMISAGAPTLEDCPKHLYVKAFAGRLLVVPAPVDRRTKEWASVLLASNMHGAPPPAVKLLAPRSRPR
jgi:hypothetical protein